MDYLVIWWDNLKRLWFQIWWMSKVHEILENLSTHTMTPNKSHKTPSQISNSMKSFVLIPCPFHSIPFLHICQLLRLWMKVCAFTSKFNMTEECPQTSIFLSNLRKIIATEWNANVIRKQKKNRKTFSSAFFIHKVSSFIERQNSHNHNYCN